jgi:pyrroloquinoline quinone (PQQ) biosynthesis protein C
MSISGTNQSGQDYIEDLREQALVHRALNHPYLQRLIDGDVPDIQSAMRDFVFQYSPYCFDFVRYLTATISQLEDEQHRKSLMRNLVEESGHVYEDNAALLPTIGIELEWVNKVPHTELFRRYLEASGAGEEYRKKNDYADDAVIWRELFYAVCSREGPCRALGAIGLGTENIVKYIYSPFIKAIENHLNISKRDRVFFDAHVALDDQHGDALTNIAIDYADKVENRKPIKEGMLMALGIRNSFFNSMESRALAMSPA